jgi:NAD(P)-dependent dehydrogenase (short-subunit alcohol dehydrogenase family)
VDLNLKGPFRLTSLVGSRMAAGRGGSIINVSSVAATRPTRDVIPYSAAKAGLNAMTIGFAHAFGPKVRVNCIMPGPFLTDISHAWDMDAFRAPSCIPLRAAASRTRLSAPRSYASEASQLHYGIGAQYRRRRSW